MVGHGETAFRARGQPGVANGVVVNAQEHRPECLKKNGVTVRTGRER